MGIAFIVSLFLIRADFPICPASNFSGYPAAVYAAGRYYAFWIDQRTYPRMAVYGTRVLSDGSVVDTAGIALYVDSAGYGCRAAYDGTNFLVVTRNHC